MSESLTKLKSVPLDIGLILVLLGGGGGTMLMQVMGAASKGDVLELRQELKESSQKQEAKLDALTRMVHTLDVRVSKIER